MAKNCKESRRGIFKMQIKLNIYGVKALINSDKQITKWIDHDYGRYTSDF